jgi:hypothetical protein
MKSQSQSEGEGEGEGKGEGAEAEVFLLGPEAMPEARAGMRGREGLFVNE